MKAVMLTAPGQMEVVDVPEPTPGPRDTVVRPRACRICGPDALYISIGGVPLRQGQTILGHEPTGDRRHRRQPQQIDAIISHSFDFSDALEALKLAIAPGAAEKVVITFG